METLAKDIMETKLITGNDSMTLEDALKVLVNNKITGFPIVNHQGKMIGILSEYDIIKKIAHEVDLNPKIFQQKIEFTQTVSTVTEETPLTEILKLVLDKKLRRVPVLDQKQKLVGIISRRDVMRLYYYRAKYANI